MNYRPITAEEIQTLNEGGCSCSDWENVRLSDPFDPHRFRNVCFTGTVRLGSFTERIVRPGGVSLLCGLYNCRIHNCTVDDNVYISNVHSIANYHIKQNVVVENTISIIVDGTTRFGNGCEIEPLNEAGGRTLKITDKTSSQIAYLSSIYRHSPKFQENLDRLITDYAESKSATMGIIEERCSITDCKTITNVSFGPWANVSGAIRLENGTVQSCQSDPATVGDGVIAKDFIFLSGSHIDDHSTLSECFVGQGVIIDKQFTAENSAFFANSEAYQGEACSIFAGPYTVTHHKSTLLIAGLYSFFNAGSGTNHSNHMYKLGPVHQGILERGSKTGSSSYLLWPSHVGPFTVVIGKHYKKFDTSLLPFSYIFEDEGRSVILPSRNLLTAGTLRDSRKWPARDRRKDPNPLDTINFELLSPYTIGRMVKGIEILRSISGDDSHQEEYVKYNGIEINRFRIDYSCNNYEMAIQIFIGNCVLSQIDRLQDSASFQKLVDCFTPTQNSQLYDWFDLSGLIAPASEISALIESVESRQIQTLDDLHAELRRIHENYENEKWSWCCSLIEKRWKIRCRDISKLKVCQFIDNWEKSSIKLNEMIIKDSFKEFDENSHIGFGLDGGAEENEKDFNAVRGRFEDHPVIADLKNDSQQVKDRARKAIRFVDSLADRTPVSASGGDR